MATIHEIEGVINSLNCNCGAVWTFKDGSLEYKAGRREPFFISREHPTSFGFAKEPQRQWVGLTDDEVREVYGIDWDYKDGDYARYARAIEAKLKEKNT
jgi:hypothetical protein